MSQETVLVPDIGSDAAEVVEVLVAPGDAVEVDQGLVVLESDKASMEIPSTVAGRIEEILTQVGAQLSEGDPVARVAMGSGTEPERDAEAAPPPPAAADPASVSEAKDAGDAADAGEDTAPIVVPVPDIGTDEAVDLIEISVSVGDEVARDDTLIVLESDKASMEVPAPEAGRILELLVSEGQALREGDAILRMVPASPQRAAPKAGSAPARESAPAKGSPSPAQPRAQGSPAGDAASQPGHAAAPPQAAGSPSASKVYAGPAVRRLARELGVDLGPIGGSGPRGRIL
jgi:pyruvate dehydrogenase E2 component (dihydrolipoamide acetyltransferase)